MKSKSIEFSEMNVYVGMDVHKKSWSVTILTDDMEYRTFEFPLFDNLLPRPAANN